MNPVVQMEVKEFNSNIKAEENINDQSAPKRIVICGSCGAVEIYIDDHKTECPNCDEYIY
jgi:hypothetical protein